MPSVPIRADFFHSVPKIEEDLKITFKILYVLNCAKIWHFNLKLQMSTSHLMRKLCFSQGKRQLLLSSLTRCFQDVFDVRQPFALPKHRFSDERYHSRALVQLQQSLALHWNTEAWLCLWNKIAWSRTQHAALYRIRNVLGDFCQVTNWIKPVEKKKLKYFTSLGMMVLFKQEIKQMIEIKKM